MDTTTGVESTVTLNLTGPHLTGVALASDGIYAVFAASWRSRFTAAGKLHLLSSGPVGSPTFHGLACR